MLNLSSPVLVVADASVLAQWVLPDEGTCPGTEQLMTDVATKLVTLLAPPLLMNELANALSVAVKRQRISSEDALLAWQAISRVGILLSDPGLNDAGTLRLSFLPGVSAYDASYVALARRHGCIFYTADKRLASALQGHSDCVRMIDRYPVKGSR